MANWEVKSYEFYPWSTGSQTHTIMVSTITDVISGKLTLTLNDTSKLSITVPTKNHTTFEPVKTLLEVKHGNDRKFFGTVTKVTKDLVNGTMKVDAVGVLGSFQFLPNYLGYSDATNLNGLIACESKRFRGYYTSGDPHYVASPWEEVYTPLGEGLIPSSFGYLDMSTYNSMHTTCNLDKVKRNAKNAYDFLKTVTKENNYSLPTEMANPSWFKWIEDGEIARFKPISGYNDQYISYKVNLMSCSMAVSPHKTRVHCYWNDGSGTLITQDQQGSDYPNPFYYARKALPNKDDGSPYIVAEVQNACYNELHEQNALVEATAFDEHLVDNSVPWLDMGKTAIIIYYDGFGEQSAQAQITQIEYDLVDSSKDRVKLGRIVSSITDSLGTSPSDIAKQIEEYLPLSGGTMTGDIAFKDSSSVVGDSKFTIRDRIFGTCNILDMSTCVQGYITSNGEDGTDAGIIPYYIKSTWFGVSANTTYTFQSNIAEYGLHYFEYDGSFRFLRYASAGQNLTNPISFTTGANTVYIRVQVNKFQNGIMQSINPSDITWAQVEKGSSPSSYVPFALDNEQLTANIKDLYSVKQNKLTAQRVEIERTISADWDASFTLSEIAQEGGIVGKTILLVIPEGTRPKASWAEVHPVMFYNSGTNAWCVHNYGTGGVAIIDFIMVYFD